MFQVHTTNQEGTMAAQAKRKKLTALQLYMLRLLYTAYTDAQYNGVWYRAANHGERVTLASLYYRGLLERRVWRGAGTHSPAHEYRLTQRVYDALHPTTRAAAS